MDFINWRHVFKVDPAKHISDEQLEQLCESGSDALIVGGTDHVTLDAVLDLLARIRRYSVPVVLEISNLESVTPGFDFYFIPTVLNSNQTKWVKDLHHQAIREFGDIMVWEELVAEGYCIVNPDCKAAHLTGANTDLQQDDVVAYARMAENLFRLPIFYLEYSGMYGDPKMVAATKDVLTKTQLFYGGGIRTEEQAQEMAKIADTVVIGNVIYDDFEAALRTVHAVKGISL